MIKDLIILYRIKIERLVQIFGEDDREQITKDIVNNPKYLNYCYKDLFKFNTQRSDWECKFLNMNLN